jgi:tetratricopeptide (TPR) repeat protein
MQTMKKQIQLLLISSLISGFSFAQDLPKPSPSAKVEQRIGLTDVSLTYSRPSVKDRKIWGDLVPYDELWRAGANKATLFQTSHDITVNGTLLPKGEYSFFIQPVEGSDWILVWNKETELWGTGDYKMEMDQIRVKADVTNMNESYESMEFRFLNVTMESADLVMDWAGKRVTLSIAADPTEQVIKNIDQAIQESKEENLWRVYRTAASYARDVNMTDQGLGWIEKSLELKENWYGYWVYAALLHQAGQNEKAVEMAKKSITVGKAEDSNFSYESRIQSDIDAWTKS